MKIGIVGIGKVGSAISFGFNRIGHEVIEHDIKFETTHLNCVLTAPLVFVCVPTPQMASGHCEINRVEDVVRGLVGLEYDGLIVIKSTVTPGTINCFKDTWPQMRFAFCPEFLRERAAFSDFVEDNDICVSGVYHACDAELIEEAHGSLPKSFARMKPIEAELCKYFCNVFNALRVVFANQFYDVCQAVNADYSVIKNAAVRRRNIDDHYLECHEGFRAFGGSCLPKDTAGFSAFVRSLKIDTPLFDQVVQINERIKNEGNEAPARFARRAS